MNDAADDPDRPSAYDAVLFVSFERTPACPATNPGCNCGHVWIVEVSEQ